MKSKTTTLVLVIVALILGVIAGRLSNQNQHAHAHATAEAATTWTCSMHPQIQLPKPGKCPLCAMDLIPLKSDAGALLGDRQVHLSPAARKLAAVAVTPVKREILTREIRMVGKIEPDETRLKTITAWMPGRLDRLYVDYTGVKVAEGDHLVYLFSPELIAAQEELIQAARAASGLTNSTVGLVRERSLALAETAREKLRLLGLTAEQITEIEQRGKPNSHLNIYSPISGIVLKKHAQEGMYVKTGSPIYQIADLSVVWLKLDAYESDLRWLHYGQDVRFESESHPGESFTGRIAFIDPVLDAKTRTVKVRVNVPNAEGRLKPGMFVRAVVEANTMTDGRVFTPDLAGKYISPMHPEIIKDGPGKCDVCGMDLVPIEEYGFATAAPSEDAPLVIPASAPLLTGKRAVVYLQVDNEDGVYEGRDIVLGPRVGAHYIVQEGLQEGDLVVVNGAFKIDSAIQIRAGTSMMNPEEKAEAFKELPETLRNQLGDVLAAYLAIQVTLGGDKKPGAHAMTNALAQVDLRAMDHEVHAAWLPMQKKLSTGADDLQQANDLVTARQAFETLSIAMIDLVRQFNPPRTQTVYEVHCPMAFDFKGASWIQVSTNIFNPYFGPEMLQCGEIDAAFKVPGGAHVK